MVFDVLICSELVHFELMDSPMFVMKKILILLLNLGYLLQSINELSIDLGTFDIFVGLKRWRPSRQ